MRSLIVMITILTAASATCVTVGQTAPAKKKSMKAQPYALTDKPLVPGVATPWGPDPQARLKQNLKQQREFRNRRVATLAAFVPAEFDAYRKALSGNNEADTARAAIQMESKMWQLASKPSPHKLIIHTYEMAWELCLQLFKNSKSEDARQLILDEWDRCLGQEGDLLVQQLTALYMEFDRRLLTADFWKLFEESKRRETMSKICYVLYKHGDRGDADRLRKRFDATALDDERRVMIWNAFNCLQWRLSGNDPNMMKTAPVF